MEVFFGALLFCLLWGDIVMLCFVRIPLRIAQNLIDRDRRW